VFVAQGTATEALEQRITGFVETPLGFLVLLVASQATFAGLALGAAALSPAPWRERLGLRPPRLSSLDWLLLLPATYFTYLVGAALLVLVFDEPSEHLLSFATLVIEAPLPWAVVMVAAASLLPGVCEELLARGFVQGRLLLSWQPRSALVFTSLVFAGFHVDPQHVLSVIPLAFWLGFVAWRAGSTWASIACHVFVNGSVMATLVALQPAPEEVVLELTPLDLGLFVVTAPAFLLIALRLWRRGARTAADAPGAAGTRP
jgi:membrane protease YdiL (CAAX protease family)